MSTIEYRKLQGPIGSSSFGVILPKNFLRQLALQKGDTVKITQDGLRIVIEKV